MAGSVYQSRYVETIVKTIDMKFEEQSRKQQERTEQLIISGINKKESSATIQGKKERFLKLSGITFHYVNRSQLEDLYYQFFQEPIIEGYALERTDEKDLGLRAQLPSNILGGGVDNKNVGKLTGNIKVPESLQGKFLRYQKERIIQNQVILGLEEVDIEDTELKVFREAIDILKHGFGLEIEQALLEIEQALLDQKMAQLKEKAAERTLTNLESANGWILMEGNFQIQQEEDSYKFTYTHPVSDYISSNPRRVVTFFFNIAVNAIEEFVRGNYALSIGSLIPLKVYGQVWRPIDRSSNRWDLPIQPLAVYQ